MDRTYSCCRWRRILIEKQVCTERLVAARHSRFLQRSCTCVAHGQVPALTRYLRVLTFSSTTKMNTFASENGDGKDFVSHAPGYWSDAAPELWNDWKWQLKNRITTLAQLEKHLKLNDEERSGVLLSGDKLALAVTPHFFNLLPANNPEDPIRRQVVPRIEETWTSPYDMADPCGEDSHMPVPGLVHRYPDRVLFLVTVRCASYCRYCTRSRVVSGVGEQELHTDFEEAFRYLEAHTEVRDVLLSGGDPAFFRYVKLERLLRRPRPTPLHGRLHICNLGPAFAL